MHHRARGWADYTLDITPSRICQSHGLLVYIYRLIFRFTSSQTLGTTAVPDHSTTNHRPARHYLVHSFSDGRLFNRLLLYLLLNQTHSQLVWKHLFLQFHGAKGQQGKAKRCVDSPCCPGICPLIKCGIGKFWVCPVHSCPILISHSFIWVALARRFISTATLSI